jgi:predicted metal-dependent peptidase
MVPVPRPGLGTLAVDQHWRLYFDGAWLQQIGVDQAAGVVLHELDHLLKRHAKRAKSVIGEDRSLFDTWNTATDAAINSGLRSEGIPLPDSGVFPDKIGMADGLSAEEYFRGLCDQKKQEQQQEAEQQHTDEADDEQQTGDESSRQDDGGDPRDSRLQDKGSEQPSPDNGDGAADQGQDGCEDGQAQDSTSSDGTNNSFDSAGSDRSQGGSDGQGDAPDASGAPETDSDCGENTQHADEGDEQGDPLVDENGDWQGEPQTGQGGSCSDGRQRPWELGPPDDENPGLDEGDQEAMVHTTAKNCLEHGDKAGGHKRWAEDILDPPVDPAAKLLNLVRRYCDVTVGVGERSYRRPSRRGGDPRMALPSNVAPLPRITVIVDTSGSMRSDDLGLALGMIRKVLNSFRIRDGIKVITGDTQGQTRQLCLSDPKAIDLAGGGGTDMATIIAEALNERQKPQMLLVCTDGWTPWPTENPGIPIIACITRKRAELPEEYKPPKWIVTLELSNR